MAIRRSGRPTANPRPPCPGQAGADPVLVHARWDLIGVVRDIDSCIGHHFDDTRRYVEVAGLAAEGDHPMEQRSMQQLGVVHRRITRAARADVEALAPFGVSKIHQAMGRLGLMGLYIRPICRTARLCGNGRHRSAAARRQTGCCTWQRNSWNRAMSSWLCVPPSARTASPASCSPRRCAPGRGRAGHRRWMPRGVGLAAMNLPVFSRAINSKGTVKVILGPVSVPVVCANALVNPGDVVVADIDGVVVVPRLMRGHVAEAARRLLDAPALEPAGLKYVD